MKKSLFKILMMLYLPAYCDVGGNGTVTIGDVTALIDMLLGGN